MRHTSPTWSVRCGRAALRPTADSSRPSQILRTNLLFFACRRPISAADSIGELGSCRLRHLGVHTASPVVRAPWSHAGPTVASQVRQGPRPVTFFLRQCGHSRTLSRGCAGAVGAVCSDFSRRLCAGPFRDESYSPGSSAGACAAPARLPARFPRSELDSVVLLFTGTMSAPAIQSSGAFSGANELHDIGVQPHECVWRNVDHVAGMVVVEFDVPLEPSSHR